MSNCWFLFQCRPPVPRGFLLLLKFVHMKTILSFLIVIVLFGCSKNSATEKDTMLPVITFTSPTNGQNFTAGQTIQITGTITDDKFIAEAHIHVTNTNTGALLMDVHIYPNGSTATFSQPLTATAGVNYKIQIIAKDRAVNESRSSVEVSTL
jgi:Bacterial Ig domain